MTDKDKPIIVIDIGTTSARCFVFNSKFEIIGRSRFEVSFFDLTTNLRNLKSMKMK